MWEALQQEKVTEQLREFGYEPGIYVYGMTGQSKPVVLNFTEGGIAILELNAMCSKYTAWHSFVGIKQIDNVSMKKGMLINTMTITTDGGKKSQFNVADKTAGVSWQKNNMANVQSFLQDHFPFSSKKSSAMLPLILTAVLIFVLAFGINFFIGMNSATTGAVNLLASQRITPEFELWFGEGDDGLYVFTVFTNLPEGTRLAANTYFYRNGERGLALSTHRSEFVENGQVVFRQGSNLWTPYPSEIIFMLWMVFSWQSEAIQNILGANGENVVSPYRVGDDTLEVEWRVRL